MIEGVLIQEQQQSFYKRGDLVLIDCANGAGVATGEWSRASAPASDLRILITSLFAPRAIAIS